MPNTRKRTTKKRTSPTRKRKHSASPLEGLINLFLQLLPSGKRGKDSGLIKIFRWSASLLVLFLFLLWSGTQSLPPPIPSGDQPALLYSNQSDDDLRALYVEAINEAKKSIFLCMYSLSDSRVIRALKDKAEQGIEVKVIHDPSTPQFGFHKLGNKVECIPRNGSGLMHQKILIVDQEKIWLGSANFTSQSLRLDANLVVGVLSPALAETILQRASEHPHQFSIGGQLIEFWSLPEDKHDALPRIISLIDTAEKTIRVAMFTWTHPLLTEAIIRAHQRHVSVEVVMDAGQAQGVCEKSFKELKKAGVFVRMNNGTELLHHKFAYIDQRTLINGSANWTKAAFSKNDDCFLILHHLTEQQVKKMDKIWHAIRATSMQKNSSIQLPKSEEPLEKAA